MVGKPHDGKDGLNTDKEQAAATSAADPAPQQHAPGQPEEAAPQQSEAGSGQEPDQGEAQAGAQADPGTAEPEAAAEYHAQAASAQQQPEEAADAEVEARVQEAVQAALAEQRDLMLRAQAEVQNMRRRSEADVEKAHKFALEKFSIELLTVVDNLERALAAVPEGAPEELRPLREGVELTLKGFLEIFNKFNIVQVNPMSEPFDPQLHQAITVVLNPQVEPNTVIDVMQRGYTLNGRVLRPAMVVVAKDA